MIPDSAGNIWVAAGSAGLWRVDRQGVATAADRGEPAFRHVSTAFEDRDGNLWVGTDRGIERWRGPVFTSYSTAQGVPSGGVGPVYVDQAGRTWFAPTSGGLYWIRDSDVGRVTQAGLDRDVIYSIDGGDGRCGSADNEEVSRDSAVRRCVCGRAFHAIRRPGAGQRLCGHRARDGAVWAGTLSGGASRFKDGVFTTHDMTSGLASNTVASILESADGTMWFATPNGLSAWSRGGWRTYRTDDGLPSSDVNSLLEDPDGTVWVGTASGLAVVQGGRVRAVREVPQALRGSILGIGARIARGSLWVKTPEHVLRVNRDALLHAAQVTSDVREYGVADGLLALESVKRHRTMVADARGRIWVTLNRGISVADPALSDGRALPALTHVEAISADGAPIDRTGPSESRRAAAGSRSAMRV